MYILILKSILWMLSEELLSKYNTKEMSCARHAKGHGQNQTRRNSDAVNAMAQV